MVGDACSVDAYAGQQLRRGGFDFLSVLVLPRAVVLRPMFKSNLVGRVPTLGQSDI